jgi:Tol biopolymer transport system component
MKSILSFKTIALLTLAAAMMSAGDGLGFFEGAGDVGNPQLKGNASYNPSTQTYTLSGAGENIWAGSDQFHFAWTKADGNFSLSTKVEFKGKGVNAHRKVGIMIRESLRTNSRHAAITVHGDGLTSLQYRAETGQLTREIVCPEGATHILLERDGDKVRVKTAKAGLSQDVTGEIEMDLPNTCYVGLFICSHEADVVETAVFTNVEYSRPPSGVISVLEILDVETGQRTTVREFDALIEAPNWTPDGKWLIYNSGGSLYRLSPDKTGVPELIDTDFAVNCNNDHVVSFDGQFIAISNSPVEDRRSHVYTVPVEGGTPRLVTPVGPSYLHGVSPDGKMLAYCADRGGNYDVYVTPTEGGREERLTTAEDLDDGPEYSPDGEYIWFNSVRSGLMQVWRMKADGSEQTQMTFDETRNSWFPHVSPDNRQVVFITYNKGDLKPNEHLANKNVELRLMPSGGGEPRTLAKLFGGQGTINVNSWAPDSRRLAFVSYRLIP